MKANARVAGTTSVARQKVKNKRGTWYLLLGVWCTGAMVADVSAGPVGTGHWQVERGETLFGIARSVAPDSHPARARARREIVRLNPQAFEDGDPNRLVAGSRLMLPAGKARPVPAVVQAQPEQYQPLARVNDPIADVSPDPAPGLTTPPPENHLAQMSRTGAMVRTAVSPDRPHAGRVVIVRGEVHAVNRAGQRRLLGRRAPVYAGDMLSTGEAASAQVRFSDGSLVLLRPRTNFVVHDYHYAGRADGEERAVYRLLKGGFRTITGMVGRHDKTAYSVETSVATIGIRGTHYSLYLCTGGRCGGLAGSDQVADLPDGLYGGVVQGRVVATNTAGEIEIATDQFFRVESGFAPEFLKSDPGILFTPEVQAGPAKMTVAAPGEQSGKGNVKPPPSEKITEKAFASAKEKKNAVLARPPTFQAGEIIQAAAAENVGDGLQLGTPAPVGAVAVVAFSERLAAGQLEVSGGSVRADGTPANRLLLGQAGNAANIVKGIVHTSTEPDDNCYPCTLGTATGQLLNVGGLGGAGVGVNWGRWSGGYVVAENGSALDTVGDFHFMYSPNMTTPQQLGALSGTASYSWLGGTDPTDEQGRVGYVSYANMDVDFGNKTLSSYHLNVKTPDQVGDRDWNASFSGSLSFAEAAEADIPLVGSLTDMSGTSSAYGYASLNFVGSDAERAMSGYGLQDDSATKTVNGTILFKKD